MPGRRAVHLDAPAPPGRGELGEEGERAVVGFVGEQATAARGGARRRRPGPRRRPPTRTPAPAGAAPRPGGPATRAGTRRSSPRSSKPQSSSAATTAGSTARRAPARSTAARAAGTAAARVASGSSTCRPRSSWARQPRAAAVGAGERGEVEAVTGRGAGRRERDPQLGPVRQRVEAGHLQPAAPVDRRRPPVVAGVAGGHHRLGAGVGGGGPAGRRAGQAQRGLPVDVEAGAVEGGTVGAAHDEGDDERQRATRW